MSMSVSLYMTRREFRELLGVCDTTLRDWENPDSPRYDPSLPSKLRLGKNTIRYNRADAIAWIESRHNKAPITSFERNNTKDTGASHPHMN